MLAFMRSSLLVAFVVFAGCYEAPAAAPVREPPPVQFAAPGEVVRVAVGYDDMCVLTSTGFVHCQQDWRPAGERRFGTFFPVPGINDVVEVVAGNHHACARTKSGGIGCWGRNDSGEVGGDEPIVRVARQVPLPGAATEVRVGNEVSCARLASGSVWCWGSFLGSARVPPVQISGLDHAARIGVTDAGICSSTDGGLLRCALGGPARPAPLGGAPVSDVLLAPHGGCALLSDATVRCFSLSAATKDFTKAVSNDPLPNLTGVVEITAGTGHMCARKNDGTVWCWGRNDYGQLGTGTRDDSAFPAQVAHLADAIEITGGGNRTCARRASGGLVCWGADLTGDGMYRALTGLPSAPSLPGPQDSLVPEPLRVPQLQPVPWP